MWVAIWLGAPILSAAEWHFNEMQSPLINDERPKSGENHAFNRWLHY